MRAAARRLAGAVLPALLLIAPAAATTVVPMSVERLTEASSHVVHARAVESWTEWNQERTLIHTYTRFEVLDSWKGAPVKAVVVRQMGGRASGYVQKVSGVRPWNIGAEAVLFLRPSVEQAGVFAVTGLMQGNFRVERSSQGVLVSNGVPEVRAMDRQTGRIGDYRGARLSLDELRSRVRRAMSE